MPCGKPSHGHQYIEDCHDASMLLTHPLLCLQEFSNSSQPACLLRLQRPQSSLGLSAFVAAPKQTSPHNKTTAQEPKFMAFPQTASALYSSRTGRGEPPRHLHFLVSPENLETLASPLEPSAWKGTESSPKLAGTAPKRR